MEVLIVLAFCMTFLAVPARTFLPVYARDIFHQGAETLALFVSLSGLGSIVGALTVAALGNVRNKGRIALTMLICLGAAMAGFALSTSIVGQLHHAVSLRRRDDRRVHDGQLARAAHHAERDARPRNERLQLRLPWRHAAWETC